MTRIMDEKAQAQFVQSMEIIRERMESENMPEFFGGSPEMFDDIPRALAEYVHSVQHETLGDEESHSEEAQMLVSRDVLRFVFVLGRTYQELEVIELLRAGKLDDLIQKAGRGR